MNIDKNKLEQYVNKSKDLLDTAKTFKDLFNYIVNNNSKNVACIYLDNNGKIKSYKYNDFKLHTIQYGSMLSKLMCQSKTNLPIILKYSNCPQWGELFYGILMAGYKPLLIDSKTSKDGTENLIKKSSAIAIISDDLNEYSITKFTLKDLEEEKPSYSFMQNWEDEVIFCSSGTTGDIKLMVFNGLNIINQIAASTNMGKETNDIIYPDKYGKINVLAMIPFHHIFGFVAVFLWYTFYGKTLVYPKSKASNDILKICRIAKVSHVYSVPLFWDSLALNFERKLDNLDSSKKELIDKMIAYNTGKISKVDAGKASSPAIKTAIQKELLGTNVRFCISGGGYLSAKTQNTINGIGYNLYNGYGMTELGVTSVDLSDNVENRLNGSIGHPLYGVSYILKPRNSNPNSGELFVKSNITHVKEIINGEYRSTVVDEQGYFATGDIAEIDKCGSFYIKGRIKDVIINSNGENIFPDELELFFNDIDYINSLCVLGIDVPGTTDQKIVIVIDVNNSITNEQLKQTIANIEAIGKNLPHNTTIDEIYLAKKALPVANNMKIKRYQIKKDLEANSPDYINTKESQEKKPSPIFDKKEIETIIVPLRKIFSKVLILPEFKINDDSHWINDLGGDSMNYVQVVLDVQDEFNITIPEDKYGKLTCINDFAAEIIRLKKVK